MRWIKKISIFFVAATFIFIWFYTISFAGSYYVSPTGSDSANGSIGSPWKTIQYAMQNTGPGDTVNLRQGSYPDSIEMRGDPGNRFGVTMGGKSGVWWTLQSYPGETATIATALSIYSVEYSKFQNFTLGSGYGLGIGPQNWITPYGQYPHDIIVDNVSFRGTQPQFGVMEVFANNLTIRNSNITITGGSGNLDHGIYLHEGSNNLIQNNVIDGALNYGLHIYGHDGGTYGSVTIENNIIRNSRGHAGMLIGTENPTYATFVGPIIIRNNILYNNIGGGFEFYRYGTGQPLIKGVRLYNNIFYHNGTAGEIVGGDVVDPTTNFVKNNIIVANGSSPHITIDNYGTNKYPTVLNNLYWPSPANLINVTDSQAKVGDPKFVNATTDFHLQGGSAAIDNGVTLSDVLIDKDGISRPQGIAYDIGAYEYVSSGGDTTPPAAPTGLTIK